MSSPRLDLQGAEPPVGPPEDPSESRKNQAGRGRKRGQRRPRGRRCLLKGCEKRFRPKHWWSLYCGESCQEQARRWSEWKAQQRYRSKAKGRSKRQAQSGRYRRRVKERAKAVAEAGGEGHGYRGSAKKFPSCDRPGCYELVELSRRSPLQRFCTRACRRAVERVRERERKWLRGMSRRAKRWWWSLGRFQLARPAAEIIRTY